MKTNWGLPKSMDKIAEQADAASLLVDLLPVGTILSHQRVITNCNSCFASLFGYRHEDLLGTSLERLYPSFKEFVDRGDEWRGYMSSSGQHCDERIMRRQDDEPIQVRVNGRCKDLRDPYMLVACTFELVSPVQTSSFKLTWRERAIVDGMSAGLTSKQIGRRLNLSHRTVETYRSRLMAKTGARNASQLLSLIR